MTLVIRNEKDGIDQMIEQARAIDGMLAGKPPSDHVTRAREALDVAVEHLSKARDSISNVRAGRYAQA